MTDEPDTIDTGLSGLTVPEPEPDLPVPVPVVVTAPVTAPPAKLEPVPDLDVAKSLDLVHAIAHNLYDVSYILKTHGLTQGQYDWLMANEWFKNAVETEQKNWNAATNVNTRLAIQSALALENALPALVRRIKAPTEPLQSVVALAKVFAEIAGAVGTGKAAEQSPQAKFKIVFNLGADQQAFDAHPMVQIDTGGGGSAPTVQSLLETPGVPAPLQTDRKGS
jgi:hypothetical protein